MNRIEFMRKLEELLQELPQEERTEAMQFYIDYFNDAGTENEQKVIAELVSPQKVAETIKADMGEQTSGEYSERGYSDTRFEQKESPAERGADEKKAWTSQPLKVVLVILIAIAACTVAWPIIAGIFSMVVAVVIGAFSIFVALVIASFCIMIAGFVVVIVGLVKLAVSIPVGLVVSGSGILLFVFGLIATVASIKLCTIVYPAMIRWIVQIIRIPFHGRSGKEVS